MKKLFKNLKNRWKRVSRKKKVLIYCIGIVVSAFLLYIVKGAPTDLENEFRRAEKANLVGPGNILGSVHVYGGSHDAYLQMLVAEDKEGLILYPYHLGSGGYTKLRYLEKTGDITFFTEPRELAYDWENTEEFSMTVGIFDTYPEAVRAEIALTLSYQINANDPVYEKTYILESQREIPGLFTFQLSEQDATGLWVMGYAMEMLMCLTDPQSYRLYYDCSVPVTVRLYGKDDAPVLEKSMEIVSYARRAHMERE